jgi:hypothetical protein
MKYLSTQFDARSECYSILTEQSLSNYMSLIERAYQEQGMISGQRDKLTSTSAIRIRKRMVEDFEKKAVFPPVVVGIVVDKMKFNEINKIDNNNGLESLIQELPKDSFSIIDGMQRTTVYKECFEKNKERKIRVEFWVTTKTESLTYRMLVLNTGQVPWNLRRQIEVVYAPLIKEIENSIKKDNLDISDKILLFRIDDKQARLKAGQFHADDVIEMYLSFGLRKEKIDTASVLAEDFTRLDLIEAMANKNFLNDFISVFANVCRLDLAFEDSVKIPIDGGKVNIGRHIFDSMPAKIGFTVACSQLIYGRVGTNKSRDEQEKSISKISISITRLVEVIEELVTEEQKQQFFSFSILNEMIQSAPTNRIGDWQRAFYLEAFRLLLSDEYDFKSFESCWRAY